MVEVVCDTDFLSSFLKIDKLELVKRFFNAEEIYIPLEVFNELSKAQDLALKLHELKCVKIKKTEIDCGECAGFDSLGKGEIGCISLCKKLENPVLLTNDVKAVRTALIYNIKVLNISAFLLLCKKNNFIHSSDIPGIINELRTKDFYEFTGKELEALLQKK